MQPETKGRPIEAHLVPVSKAEYSPILPLDLYKLIVKVL